ncbi:hypothetical protein GGR50DRAFT_67159 [Xylaria sp. CBS 124048]|nr:hypothetical protein GGR50DRAFT_67159 [Xylaria sp. CBS 124048]
MLLRQFRRPSPRSVTAAWQPATTIPTQFHPGSCRAHSNKVDTNNEDPQGREDGEQEATPSSPAPSERKVPLIEKLFPTEVKRFKSKLERDSKPETPLKSWLSDLLAQQLSYPTPPGDRQDEGVGVAKEEEKSEFQTSVFRAQSMLILSAVSKNLLESDFLRLGVKGKHVDGWVGGILKVIQARNPDTLEPQGHYFILFDTHEAATLYKERVEELWRLGKTHIPGAHHSWSHRIQSPLPKGLLHTKQGEDVASLIRSFTLIQPSQRHSLEISRMDPAKVERLYVEGGFVDELAERTGSRFIVLVRLDGGRLTLNTLCRAIEEDGLSRNLPWRITNLNNDGILPFGKSVLKEQDRLGDPVNKQSANDDTPSQDALKKTRKWRPGRTKKEHIERQYPRFLIPFTDKAEAHRFVRSWHRRELRVQKGIGTTRRPIWEEIKVINATVLW